MLSIIEHYRLAAGNCELRRWRTESVVDVEISCSSRSQVAYSYLPCAFIIHT